MTRVHSILASLALIAPAAAQGTRPSISVDVGNQAIPMDDYGAAGPVGAWNRLNSLELSTGGSLFTSGPLIGLDGLPVLVTYEWDSFSKGFIRFGANAPFTTGADQRLLDDFAYTGGASELRISGLAPGAYGVIVYAFAADSPTLGMTLIDVVGSPDDEQVVGGSDFSMGFGLGATHSMHITTVGSDGQITVEISATGAEFDSVNGFQVFPLEDLPSVGTSYCGPAVPNVSGLPAKISALGSTAVSSNALSLRCEDMGAGSFGFFLASTTQDFVVAPGGSAGNLCLGGSIGRFYGPGQIQSAGADGSFEIGLDLTRLPQPTSNVAAQPGQTWSFTAWFRDVQGGAATSNFADGVAVNFE